MVEQDKNTMKTVNTFATASFLNDMGSDMIYPLWPIFVVGVLGAPVWVLGLLDGLGNTLVAFSKVFSGWWSDKIGKRKPFIWTGYLMGSLSRFGYALSTVWPMLIPFRILDRFGKIRGPPRDALISELSTPETRGSNFGFIKSMDNLGAVVGIIIVIILVNFLTLRTIFFLAAIPSMIGAILIYKRVKETGKEAP